MWCWRGFLSGARCKGCHCYPMISCFIEIQNGLTFLVPAYQGCPVKEAVKRVSACFHRCHSFLGDCFLNSLPFAIGPLSVLSVCPVCLSVLSVCNVGVLWPNGWMDQDEAWHAGRPRSWPHCVKWGPSSPPSKGHSPPSVRPVSVVAKWLDGLRCHLVWR